MIPVQRTREAAFTLTASGRGDGALIATIVEANAAADRAEQTGDERLESEHRQRGTDAWVALLREDHASGTRYLHVRLYYNYVKASLHKRRADLGEVVEIGRGDELDGPFTVRRDAEGIVPRVVPYDATRTFFTAIRDRLEPWNAEHGDEGFHHYMRTVAMRAATRERYVGYTAEQLDVAVSDMTVPWPQPDAGSSVAGSSDAAAVDARLVRAVLLDALATPRIVRALIAAPVLVGDDDARALRAFIESGSAAATPVSAPGQSIVTAATVRRVLGEVLDRLVRFQGFVGSLGSSHELLVDALIRQRKYWDVLWRSWCAALPPETRQALCPDSAATKASLRAELTARLRQHRLAASADDVDRTVESLLATRRADEFRQACEAALHRALAEFVARAAAGLDRARALPDATDRHVVAGYHAGRSAADIASPLGAKRESIYKRFERIGKRIAADVAAFAARRSSATEPADG